MLDGAARKVSFGLKSCECIYLLFCLLQVALALVFVSACGWIVFVTGFGIRNAE